MTWLRRNWLYIVLTVAVAFAVHVASGAFLPQLVMTRALAKMSRLHGYNTMTHQPRVTSASRAVVRPSPDLLYSACPYDLDKAGGVLRVSVTGMPKTYWSISIFDAETNNFYALNNSEAKNGSADVVVTGHYDRLYPPPHPGDKLRRLVNVPSPTTRGLVLVRTLIVDDKNLPAIDKARRTATCAPYRY